MSRAAESPAANVIPVRMGELVASRDANDVFSVIGLGSCVAVILVAPEQRAASLAHVVLPAARMTGGHEAPPAKFADTAVAAMLSELRPMRVKPEDTYAVLVGGATMFGGAHTSRLAAVGERNIEAARGQLGQYGIGIASEDIGGTAGRSVHVSMADLAVSVRSGIGEPIELAGSDRPLVVKVSTAPADSDAGPFPDDIFNSGSSKTTP